MALTIKNILQSALLICVASPSGAFAQDPQQNWKRLEADNGAVFAIDLNSISNFNNGTVQAVTCVVDNKVCLPPNMSRLWFDCNGHYRDIDGRGPTLPAPSHSVVGRMAQIACVGAKDARFDDDSPPQSKPTSDQYCVGFSPESCVRIVATVEKRRRPAYCKPGFGLVGSGLSSEQVRICSVIGSDQARATSSKTTKEKSKTHSYNMELSATNGQYPNIVGRTNLPDGTKLLVSITKPRLANASDLLAAGRPMCENDCIPAAGPKGEVLGVATTVVAGSFSAGSFSWAGKPFRRGTFEVEIFLVSLPGEQPRSLQEIEEQVDRMSKPILTRAVAIVP